MLSSRLRGQSSEFPGIHSEALKQLAATVLPEQLGREGTDAVAAKFARWVSEYRAGAEMQTGYGTTRVRYKPASPAPRYREQLGALSAGVFTAKAVSKRRLAITELLRAAKITDMPISPDGNHIATDLMAFYFQNSEANDLAYQAAIGKDTCRTLRNSGQEPVALRKEVIRGAL